MTLVPGVETIQGLTGEPPPEIPIDHKVMAQQQILLKEWNNLYIAIIPYCFKCKVPLVWHIPHTKDNEVFVCPSCGRVWVVKEQNDKTKKDTRTTS